MTGRRIMAAEDVRRATTRISHEIVEKQAGTDGLVADRHPAPRRAARRIASPTSILEHEGAVVPVGALDITFYRDDLSLVAQQPIVKGTAIPFDLNGRDGRARGRRALHGPHDPGRDGRPDRLRAAAGDPARGPRRPRPPRAARSAPTTSARTSRRRARRSSRSASRRPTARTPSRSSGCRSPSPGGRRPVVTVLDRPPSPRSTPRPRRSPCRGATATSSTSTG